MTEKTLPQANVATMQDEDEINLLDLLIVLAKHKKRILILTFCAAILSVGYALMLPKIYTGTAKILPPQQSQSGTSALLSQLGGLAGAAAGIKNPNDMYVGMLNSRTVMDRLIQRFNLQKTYDKDTLTDTRKKLDDDSNIATGKDGIITVDVDNEDPKLAAALANAFVEEMDRLMQKLAVTEAAQRRMFFEKQLKEAKDKLTDAEVVLDKTLRTSLQYMDALRELKYREAVYEIDVKQYEAAKLDEAKDSALIQVLDKAIEPEKRSKPKRTLIVILATLVAGFIGVLWAFVAEANEKARHDPEQAERLNLLRGYLRGEGV